MANEFGSNATVDAVHPRFRSDRNVSESVSTSISNIYLCTECNVGIGRTLNDLRTHFQTREHLRFTKCVYCNGNVYSYCFSSSIQYFHECSHSRDEDSVSVDIDDDSISVSSNDVLKRSAINGSITSDQITCEEHSVVNGNVMSDRVSSEQVSDDGKPSSSIVKDGNKIAKNS